MDGLVESVLSLGAEDRWSSVCVNQALTTSGFSEQEVLSTLLSTG